MTDDRNFEERLAAWLEEDGPQDVPERVVDMAFAEAAAARRQRPLPHFVGTLLDGATALQQGRQAPLAHTRLIVALVLSTVIVTGLVIAGAYLLDGDFGRRNGPIAFDYAGDIWIVDPDGTSAPEQVTDTLGIVEGSPVWSPDGFRLAYWVTNGPTAEIHIWGPDSRLVILRDPDGHVLPLNAGIFGWSPDGDQIVAPARGSVVADGVTRLGVETVVVIDVEERSGQAVPLDSPGWSFGWSPDGKKIGLVAETDILVFDPGTGRTESLGGETPPDNIDHPYWLRQAPPAFSADGRTIFYTASGPIESGGTGAKTIREDGDIHSVVVGGTEHELVFAGPANDLAPVIAPDGDRIAFGRSSAVTTSGAFDFVDRATEDTDLADLGSDLLVASASGGPAELVASGVWPVAGWSPDGTRLVAKSFDGSELVVITPGDTNAEIRIPVGDGTEPIGGFSWGQRMP